MINDSHDGKEEKLENISDVQNNQIYKYTEKEKDSINEKEKKSLIKNNEFDFKYDTSLNKILPVGLKNLGNSCFMNCCLQCFYHCSKFTSELLENYQKYEKINCPALLCFLEVLKNLYINGKESCKRKIIILSINDYDTFESEGTCCCKKRRVINNNKSNYYKNETVPVSAKGLYLYIIKNYSNEIRKNGSDPKMEVIQKL